MKLVTVDFDNTLLKKDSFFYFILFDRGIFRLISIVVIFSPLLVLIKIIPKLGGFVKSLILQMAFRDRSFDDLIIRCRDFYFYLKNKNYFNEELLVHLTSLKEDGYEICIVSASPDFIIKPVAEAFNYKFIATQFKYVDGKFTGKYLGKNCKGIEKVMKIKDNYDLSKLTHFIAIGNRDDKEMLELADECIVL